MKASTSQRIGSMNRAISKVAALAWLLLAAQVAPAAAQGGGAVGGGGIGTERISLDLDLSYRGTMPTDVDYELVRSVGDINTYRQVYQGVPVWGTRIDEMPDTESYAARDTGVLVRAVVETGVQQLAVGFETAPTVSWSSALSLGANRFPAAVLEAELFLVPLTSGLRLAWVVRQVGPSGDTRVGSLLIVDARDGRELVVLEAALPEPLPLDPPPPDGGGPTKSAGAPAPVAVPLPAKRRMAVSTFPVTHMPACPASSDPTYAQGTRRDGTTKPCFPATRIHSGGVSWVMEMLSDVGGHDRIELAVETSPARWQPYQTPPLKVDFDLGPARQPLAVDVYWNTWYVREFWRKADWIARNAPHVYPPAPAPGSTGLGIQVSPNNLAGLLADWAPQFRRFVYQDWTNASVGGVPIKPLATDLEMVAHEYFHAIMDDLGWNLGNVGGFNDEQKAMVEGLADVFANIAEASLENSGVPDFTILESVGTIFRNLQDPKNNNAGFPPGTYNYFEKPPPATPHQYGTLVGLVYSLLCGACIQSTVDGCLPPDPTAWPSRAVPTVANGCTVAAKVLWGAAAKQHMSFDDLRAAAVTTAKGLFGDTSLEKKAVVEAFRAVGLAETTKLAAGDLRQLEIGRDDIVYFELPADPNQGQAVKVEVSAAPGSSFRVAVDDGYFPSPATCGQPGHCLAYADAGPDGKAHVFGATAAQGDTLYIALHNTGPAKLTDVELSLGALTVLPGSWLIPTQLFMQPSGVKHIQLPPIPIPKVGPDDLLVVRSFGGVGDVDLYLRPGVPAQPEDGQYLLGASGPGTEHVLIADNDPQPGHWYVAVHAPEGGASDVTLMTGYGLGELEAVFDFACTWLECRFDAGDAVSDLGIERYDWSFGDGATANAPAPVHLFARPGSFDVTLTVTDIAGGSARLTRTVNVVEGGCQAPPSFAGVQSVANAGGGQCEAEVRWQPATSDCGGSFRYEIYQAAHSGVQVHPDFLVGTSSGTSFRDAGLLDGGRYYYRVRARDPQNGLGDDNQAVRWLSASCDNPLETSFSASPASSASAPVAPGTAVTLSWSVPGEAPVLLVGFGELPASGSVVVRPEVTTIYTLFALETEFTVTVHVTEQATPVRLEACARPCSDAEMIDGVLHYCRGLEVTGATVLSPVWLAVSDWQTFVGTATAPASDYCFEATCGDGGYAPNRYHPPGHCPFCFVPDASGLEEIVGDGWDNDCDGLAQ